MNSDLSLCDEYCTTCVHAVCTQHGSCSECAGTNNREKTSMTIWHETPGIDPDDIFDAEDEGLGTGEVIVYQPPAPPESPVEEAPIVENPS